MRRPILLLAVFLLLPAGPARSQNPSGLGPAERVYGLSLIWKEAAYNFPYFDQLPGLDWDAAYREAVPRVLAARSTLDYYRALQRFTALLQDGHTRVHLPDSIVGRRPFSSPWVDLQAVGGRALVSNVATELADSLPVGSEIVSVEGATLDEYLARHVLPFVFASAPHSRRISAIEGSHSRGYGLLVGPPGEPVRVRARTPAGREVHLTLARDRFDVSREWVRSTEAEREPLVELTWPAPGIARLALNSFSDRRLVVLVDSLSPELLQARGVVLDLRRNGGGNDVVAGAVLARFTDEPLVGTAWRVRVNDAYYRALGSFGRSALERALPPEDSSLVELALRHYAGEAWRYEEPDTLRPAFEGRRISAPVAVLVGRGTASAAENFLVRLPDDDRFVIVGTPTAASTGQPLRFRLPGGGMGQVVTRAVLLPDGTPLVKTGVVPDVRIAPTPADVREGRDPVLDRAVQLLEVRVGSRSFRPEPPSGRP
ncbi:MAG: S41 family peptidase [Gemmatimonadota bacterium]|jgi:C-terminal processing protease CtpA/Prc